MIFSPIVSNLNPILNRPNPIVSLCWRNCSSWRLCSSRLDCLILSRKIASSSRSKSLQRSTHRQFLHHSSIRLIFGCVRGLCGVKFLSSFFKTSRYTHISINTERSIGSGCLSILTIVSFSHGDYGLMKFFTLESYRQPSNPLFMARAIAWSELALFRFKSWGRTSSIIR
jgi:hypothetical protein